MHESPRFALFLLSVVLFKFSVALAAGAGSGTQGAASSSGGGGNCGQVKCDCSTHKISIGGKEETINCGKDATTRNGTGKVGGPHHGQVVKDGVNIESPGMGQEGGGKVFHLPFGGSEPNGSDSTKGCIAVSKAVLEQLKSCQGAPLEITGSGSSGGDGGGSASQRSPASTTSGRSRAGR